MEKKDNLPMIVNYEDPKTLQVLKTTVAKGATDDEFQMFVAFCRSTGLNPYKKEIWFIKDKTGRVQMMTGINGFYEIANRHPQFDGLECEPVEQGGKLIKYVARCYRKDRSRPMVAEAYMAEYGKDYGNWKTMPRVMLSKCAEAMALRKSFPQELNGLYTAEEMPREFSADDSIRVVAVESRPAALPKSVAQDKPQWMDDADQERAGSNAEDENQDPPRIFYKLDDYAARNADKWPGVQRILEEKGCTLESEEGNVWSCPMPFPKFRGMEINPDEYFEKEAA